MTGDRNSGAPVPGRRKHAYKRPAEGGAAGRCRPIVGLRRIIRQIPRRRGAVGRVTRKAPRLHILVNHQGSYLGLGSRQARRAWRVAAARRMAHGARRRSRRAACRPRLRFTCGRGRPAKLPGRAHSAHHVEAAPPQRRGVPARDRPAVAAGAVPCPVSPAAPLSWRAADASPSEKPQEPPHGARIKILFARHFGHLFKQHRVGAGGEAAPCRSLPVV